MFYRFLVGLFETLFFVLSSQLPNNYSNNNNGGDQFLSMDCYLSNKRSIRLFVVYLLFTQSIWIQFQLAKQILLSSNIGCLTNQQHEHKKSSVFIQIRHDCLQISSQILAILRKRIQYIIHVAISTKSLQRFNFPTLIQNNDSLITKWKVQTRSFHSPGEQRSQTAIDTTRNENIEY